MAIDFNSSLGGKFLDSLVENLWKNSPYNYIKEYFGKFPSISLPTFPTLNFPNPSLPPVHSSKEIASSDEGKTKLSSLEDSLWDKGSSRIGNLQFIKENERQFKVYDNGKYFGTFYAPDLLNVLKQFNIKFD